MTGREIYEKALDCLGYSDDQVFKNKAVTVINQVYGQLYRSSGQGEYRPIKAIGDEVALPEEILSQVFIYGVAERLALGEGDGELQQYFAARYDRARAGINRTDNIDMLI